MWRESVVAKVSSGWANSSIRFGRSFKLDRPVQEVNIFYVGREGQTLTNLLISYSRSQVSDLADVRVQRRVCVDYLSLLTLIWRV